MVLEYTNYCDQKGIIHKGTLNNYHVLRFYHQKLKAVVPDNYLLLICYSQVGIVYFPRQPEKISQK